MTDRGLFKTGSLTENAKLSCKQVEYKNQGYIDQTLVV